VRHISFKNATQFIASFAAFTAVNPVFAHEGHGMGGSHWHATDVWGFVAFAGAVALAVWLSRGGK
jgi:hypothetical protein